MLSPKPKWVHRALHFFLVVGWARWDNLSFTLGEISLRALPEELPPSDWPVDKSMEHILDERLVLEGLTPAYYSFQEW